LRPVQEIGASGPGNLVELGIADRGPGNAISSNAN
jgi:hypothetical protein